MLFTQSVSADPRHEFEAERTALIDATVAFFDEVETAAPPKPSLPVLGIPFSTLKTRDANADADVMTRHGPVNHLTVYRLTWYPTEHLLGTVDFMGTWDGNRNLVCGYLTWDLTDPDAPVLETVAASFVDVNELSSGTYAQAHLSLLEANCAFGGIDENYRVFEPTG